MTALRSRRTDRRRAYGSRPVGFFATLARLDDDPVMICDCGCDCDGRDEVDEPLADPALLAA
jgi:hypothetical protein